MEEVNERNGFEIAVVGMSGRFPGAGNIDRFWENLKNGVNSIRFFTEEELLKNTNLEVDLISNPDYIKAKGIIDKVEYFDAFFFGYSPLEAEVMDPQIRIFYEICWEALEDAGCDPSSYDGAIGVYAGGSSNRWWELLAIMSGKFNDLGEFSANNICDKDYLSTRISHKLDLKGPSVSIHTACSTALVGVDMACRGLLTGQCDAALVGGVSVLSETAKGGGYLYEEGMIRSNDGYVRAFDAKAKGVVFSQGAGVVFLKRLEDALAERDHIYSVIKGFAVNNDGIVKSSFSAPAVDGEVDVIKAALYMAEVEPESITYVETHGTGTEIGDPIEVEAIKTAFNTEKKHYCAIGSLKPNIGHLDVAAGIVSLIKVALMMEHRQIPPSLNFKTPNPKIDFENSPFFVNTELREWKRDGHPLRAGVSSFGVGGTNAHVVLEEAPPLEPTGESRSYQLILLSARSTKALEQSTRNFANYLKENPGVNLADVAYTLKVGRKGFEHRKIAVCRDIKEAAALFQAEDDRPELPTHYEKEEKRAVFMFPGQGSQYVNMARGLYESESKFREEMDRCFDILKPIMDIDIREVLYIHQTTSSGDPAGGSPPGKAKNPDQIDRTEVAQPLIFAVEYALAKLLTAWGITPYAMIGHSVGEYAAACLAGVFSLEDALTVVAWRGKLMQQMPPGSMLSVPLPEEKLKPLLNSELALAAVNGPAQCVVSGPAGAIETFSRLLEEKGLEYRKLHTTHAFHSSMMDPILKDFEKKVAQVTLNEPGIPFISNLTGKWISNSEAKDPGYWSGQIRSAVRFADGAAELLKETNSVFIEVGPGSTLNTFIKQHADKGPGHMSVNLIKHPKEDIDDLCYLLNKIGLTWLYGVSIDWEGFYTEEKRRRLCLPTYPFQRQYYWIEGNPITMIKKGMGNGIVPNKSYDISQWFYTPSWKRSVIYAHEQKETAANSQHKWLLFVGDCGFSSLLVKKMISRHGDEAEMTMVHIGKEFAKKGDDLYTVDPRREEDYEKLIENLHDAGRFPDRIIHMWNLSSENNRPFARERVENYLDLGFYSLLSLARTLGKYNISNKIEITVLTNGMFEVWDEKVTYPEKAALLGPLSIIPLEYPEIKCRVFDIILPEPGQESWLQEQLLKESDSEVGATVLAYRGHRRLERNFELIPLNRRESNNIRLKEKGVYLITGGLGGIGLVFARHLAKNFKAKLFLTGRSFFPAREEWPEWLHTHPSLDKTTQNIRKVKELEALGGQVRVYSVDAADEKGMSEMVAEIRGNFGTIDGVIHSAGVPGGGMIQLKTREIADRVLSSKVMGTLALNKALQGVEPDFFILCSSIASVVPQIGQVDYFAANAFMDAYAFYKNAHSGTLTTSINWDAWQEVGMAVEAAKKMTGNNNSRESRPIQVEHPLFDHFVTVNPPGGALQAFFTTYFSIERHWVMSDHRSKEGRGIVPGVTYLEMAHAAIKILTGNKVGEVEIRNVFFLNPLIVEKEEEKESTMILEQAGDGYEFTVSSRANPGENEREIHVKGEVVFIEASPRLKKRNIAEIEKKCDKEEIDTASIWRPDAPDSMLIYGPRWNNIKRIKAGEDEGIALLELPAEFESELKQYTLYPSMLDFGAAFLTDHINDQSPYIPYSYKKLKVYRPFPVRIYSFGRWLDEGKGKANLEFLRFNLVFMDEEGNELAEVEEFTLLEISQEILKRLKDKQQGKKAAAASGDQLKFPPEKTWNEELVQDGIAPSEGIEAFNRILFEELPQVVVSTKDLAARMKAGQTAEEAARKIEETRVAGPVHERPDISSIYTAPNAGVEQKLADIWQNLLGIDKVGVMDDFFELGGDSLKATTMIRKIKESFGSDITVREIFNALNIKELSKSLKDHEGTVIGDAPVKPLEKREYYPLTTMQERLYILNKMEGIGTAYNLPVFIRIKEEPEIVRIERALKALILRHESLRSTFEIWHDQPVQVVHENVDFILERKEIGEGEITQVIKKFIRPFDLAAAPLFRAGLIKLVEEEHLLMLDAHHIVTDATSYTIIMHDFYILFEGGDMYLPPLPLQYKDFSSWQNSGAGKALIKKQQAYWLSHFRGTIPILDIFTDYPRPAAQSFAGGNVDFKFDEELTRELHQLMKETGTTLFMVLLAAFNILLSKYSGQEDIIVGTPVAGRESGDFGNVIGVFINALALRNYPGGGKRFVDFLEEVKEHTLDAYENQGYPFGKLLDKLDLKPDFSRNPVFDVELIVQNIEAKNPDVGGKKFYFERYETEASQLDISLEAVEGNNKVLFAMTYCTELFKRDTIEKFIDFFTKIIRTVIEDKEIKLANIHVPHELAKAKERVPLADEIKFGF